MALVPLYRYHHPQHNDHLYTTDIHEIGHANHGQPGNHGYVSEGQVGFVFSAPQAGTSPLYRYYHEGHKDHFYTTNISEIGHANHGQLGNHGFKSEGTTGHIYTSAYPGAVPLYRYFHEAHNNHFYSTNASEIGATQPGQVGQHGYKCEGIVGYVLSQPYPTPTPGYPAQGYPAPGYPAPGYPAPGYPAPGYPTPGFSAPGGFQAPGASPFYRYIKEDTNDHFYTTNASEIGATQSGQQGQHGYKCEGTAGKLFTQQAPGTVPLYRYYHAANNDHFYTTNISEIGHANQGQQGTGGYVSEGIAGFVYPSPAPNTTPLYRYFKNDTHDHFYTTNPSEIGATQPGQPGHHGYTCEGVAGHVLL